MARTGSIGSTTGFLPGDHACWVFDGEEAWREIIAHFLDEGADEEDSLLYAAAKGRSELISDLYRLPRRDELLEAGRLQVMSLSEDPDQPFDPRQQIAAVEERARRAVKEGFRGLRVAADATSLAIEGDEPRGLIAYELLVGEVIDSTPTAALCGYDGRRLSRRRSDSVCYVHPLQHGQDGGVAGALYHDDDRWVVEGDIDIHSLAAFRNALAALPDGGEIELDLSALGFISVAGLRAIVELSCRPSGHRRVVLHDPPDIVDRLVPLAWPDSTGVVVVRGGR